MNRLAFFAFSSALALALSGCSQQRPVLTDKDLEGFKGHPAEQKPASDAPASQTPDNPAPAEPGAPSSSPDGVPAPDHVSNTPGAPEAGGSPSGLSAQNDSATPAAPRRSMGAGGNNGRPREARPADRTETDDFTIASGARVVVQGAFKLLDGKVVAWKADGSPNPALQKEIGDQMGKVPAEMKDRAKEVMARLSKMIFVVSEVEGNSKPGTVRADFGGGFGGGMMAGMMFGGGMGRDEGRIVCMAEEPKAGEALKIRYRVMEKDPMTATLAFTVGSTAPMGSGKVTVQTIKDGAPPQGGEGDRRMGGNFTPTSYAIISKSGLPRSPFSIEIIGKDGKAFTMLGKDGKPTTVPGMGGPGMERPNREGGGPQGRPGGRDWTDVRRAYTPMGNDADSITIGFMVKRDLISSIKLTLVPETIVERTGIAAKPN